MQGGGIAAAQGLAHGLMPAQVGGELPGAGRTLPVNWRLIEELPSCCKMHSGQTKPRPPHAPGGSARAATASGEIHLFQAAQRALSCFLGEQLPCWAALSERCSVPGSACVGLGPGPCVVSHGRGGTNCSGGAKNHVSMTVARQSIFARHQ